MLTHIINGAIDPRALRAALRSALGPEGSPTWWLAAGPSRACVTCTDELFAQAQAILDAHVAPQAAETRAAALLQGAALSAGGPALEDRQTRALAKIDPLKALLMKGGLV